MAGIAFGGKATRGTVAGPAGAFDLHVGINSRGGDADLKIGPAVRSTDPDG
jgi:hypothetical protein